jgi:hypothetical protein
MNWGWLNAPVSLNLSIGLLLFIISGSCFMFAWRTGRQADGRYGTKWARRFCIWSACLGIVCWGGDRFDGLAQGLECRVIVDEPKAPPLKKQPGRSGPGTAPRGAPALSSSSARGAIYYE